jgi:hypothetical protein
MGNHATEVQEYLAKNLARGADSFEWHAEYRIGSNPVEIAGVKDNVLIIVELEWRPADPSDNTAKLFRHLNSDTIDESQVIVAQLFTDYYDLSRGGISSKRLNAEFVGKTAANAYTELQYHAVDLCIDPPKQGQRLPEDWRDATDDALEIIQTQIL